jgi:hypothetical protein
VPIATSHDERSLSDLMLRTIKGNQTILRWDFESEAVADAVSKTLFAYFGDAGGAIEDATNIARLERLARVAIWGEVVEAYTTHLDFTAGQTKIPRATLKKHAEQELERAMATVAQKYGIRTARIRYADVDDAETEEFEQ